MNFDKKKVSMAQVWACVLLTVLALVMSLLPIIKLSTGDPETKAQIAMLAEKMDINMPEIEDDAEISAVKLVKSASLMVNMVSVATDKDPDPEKVEKLEEKMNGKEGQDTALTALALVNTFVDVFDKDGEDQSEDSAQTGFFTIVFEVLVVFVAIIGILTMTIILSILFAIRAVKALIVALKNKETPELAIAGVNTGLTKTFSLVMTLMLLQTLLPGMSYGVGLIGLLVIAIGSAVLNTAVTRLQKYGKDETMYLNLVQGASVVGLVGFFVFFFNFLKTNTFSNFLHGSYTQYMGKVMIEKAAASALKQELVVNNAYIIDGVVIIALIALIGISTKYLISCVSRLSCTVKKGKSDCFLFGAIVALVVNFAIKYLVGSKHGYSDITSTASEGDFSFLILNADEEKALGALFVGVILMLVAEIALMVLKKVLCKNLAKDTMDSIVSGSLVVEETPVAEEAPVVEEAPVAEEAPVEEKNEVQ